MNTSAKPLVTICSSCNFYRQANDVKDQLEKLGVDVIVPKLATKMKESGDYEVSHYKTWFADPNDYGKKGELMRAHFDEVEKADAILVLNYEKHGKQNYIGPNVLMEMALAFHMDKPIFIINEYPEDTPFEEELKGMTPVLLHGKIEDLPVIFDKLANE
ncbi:MAG TPA: hypothetical protein VGO07_00415 [Candidatus Saccharimonadales bacterium]|jgi:hypothetical protein|nr:hypothetical protein [Candidatus Saccharimonadales bacterium]